MFALSSKLVLLVSCIVCLISSLNICTYCYHGHPIKMTSYPYVIDWLEDIGLPQYKDSFRDNIVDGRMLNYLTVVCTVQLQIKMLNHFRHDAKRGNHLGSSITRNGDMTRNNY